MPRTAHKQEPAPKQQEFAITPIYDILLRGSDQTPVGLFHLYVATAEQLCTLHYSRGSLKAIKARLKKLVDAGYIQFDAIPTKFARSPYYYALDYRGMYYLEEIGLDVNEAFRKQKEVNKHSLYIEHTLVVNKGTSEQVLR